MENLTILERLALGFHNDVEVECPAPLMVQGVLCCKCGTYHGDQVNGLHFSLDCMECNHLAPKGRLFNASSDITYGCTNHLADPVYLAGVMLRIKSDWS